MPRADSPPTTVDSVTVPNPVPPCPRCGYDLTGTVESEGDRCPECGWEFTPQDLALLGPSNLSGQPRSLKPADRRMGGPWLLVILALVSIAFVAAALYLARR
jgi:hypothetical protein